MATLTQAMARTQCRGRLYADLTVTDTPLGSPHFYLSDSHFLQSNVFGGAPVYPVVHSWGELLNSDGSASVTITLAANAYMVPANGTTRKKVLEWLQALDFIDSGIDIYQWGEETTSPGVVWSGVLLQIENLRLENGVPMIDLVATVEKRDLQLTPISDVLNKTDFPNAPLQNLGLMVPRLYGDIPNRIFSGGPRNMTGMVGFPMIGAPGLIVDENQTSASVKVRFAKGDGTSAFGTFVQPSAGDPSTEGDLWIWDESLASYGLVDVNSYTFTNSSSALEVVVKASPKVYFYVRPSLVGGQNAGAFTSMNKLIDSDLSNYIESTTTDAIWAWEAPDISVGAKIVRLWVLVDWLNAHASKQRKIQFGLWNVDKTGGAGYLDSAIIAPTTAQRASALSRALNISSATYTSDTFTGSTGPSTWQEFKSGHFISRDVNNTDHPIQVKCEVIDLGGVDAGKDGVRVYHLCMIVEVDYPQIPKWSWRPWNIHFTHDKRSAKQKDNDLRNAIQQYLADVRKVEADAISRMRGTQFLVTGAFQKDNGSGTYTGSANSNITKPCDIANHIIHELIGEARVTTSGVPGNFIDPRSYGVLSNLVITVPLGTDNIKQREALDMLNERMPMTVFKSAGTWKCIPDDMNPDPSRFYRSTSDLQYITADDIEQGSFSCGTTDPKDLVNSVVLKHAHGFPNREAGAQQAYDHALSQMYWGKKEQKVYEEPMLRHAQFDTAPTVSDLTRWYGRRQARPRLLPRMRLSQRFYDLDRGYVLQLQGLETALGIPCPAHRCGYLDYHFTAATSTTNLADSTSGGFVNVGSTSEMYLGFQQQTDEIDFLVSVAAAYTTVANSWEYYDWTQTWTAITDANTTNKDAIKSTGLQKLKIVRPTPHLWAKQELSFGAFGVAGPCYWLRMKYIGAGTAGTMSGRTTYPAVWLGRLFEVLRATRTPSGVGDYMAMDVQLREVM